MTNSREQDQQDIILVADDTPSNVELVSKYLQKAGYAVLTAGDGQAVLQRINHTKPDLILLDIMMPDLDGFETCRRLKENQETKDIPIIFMTALSDIQDKIKGFEMGAVDYITKPLDNREILARVNIHLTLRNLQKTLREQNEQLQAENLRRKRVQEALKESRERYRLLAENSTDMISRQTPEGLYRYVSPACRMLLGYEIEEMIGRSAYEFFHPEDLKALKELIKSAAEGPTTSTITYRAGRKDNRYIWLETTNRIIHDQKTGRALEIIAISRDVTERKKAEEMLRQQNEQLATLHKIGQTITAPLELKVVLDTIAHSAANLLATDTGVISLLDQSCEYLHIKSAHGLSETVITGTRDRLGESISGRVAQTGQPIIANDLPNDVRFYNPAAIDEGLLACASVPLAVGGRIIGALEVYSKSHRYAFNRQTIQILKMLASQAAIAIENARLFDEERQAREAAEIANSSLSEANARLQTLYNRMQDELALAQEIQSGLLPPPRPNWPQPELVCFSAPARQVGGDFYDYHAFPTRGQDGKYKYAVAIGDVSGKGVSAALLMATCLAQLDAALLHDQTPEERLIYLDRAITFYAKSRQQNCALCYGELILPAAPPEAGEKMKGEFYVINAGCIPPYVRRANGRVEELEVGGFALGQGLGAQHGYKAMSLTLSPGDMVIFTSDGVVEANNSRNTMFGFERMKQAIANGPQTSAQALLDHLKAELAAFTGETEAHDDITIVILKI
jgi:PAS domain S-box-containing protein